jgi:hypothetical protein
VGVWGFGGIWIWAVLIVGAARGAPCPAWGGGHPHPSRALEPLDLERFALALTLESRPRVSPSSLALDLERAHDFDWGIEEGHTTQEQLRLTIEARREKTKELIDAGMSQRQAAKALGVGLGTVQRDLIQSGSESDPKRVTKADRRAQRELGRAARHTRASLPGYQKPRCKSLTLADAGIDKNLAKEGRKLGALSEREFERRPDPKASRTSPSSSAFAQVPARERTRACPRSPPPRG